MKKLSTLLVFLSTGTFVYAQTNADQVPLITVTGESVVHVKPDEVTMTFGVETKNADAKVAKTENDKLMSDVLKYLKSQKIDPKNIQTDYVRLNSMYVYNNDKERKEEFVAVNTVSLKITDIDKYEEISSGLIDRGINKIDQVSFGSSKMKEHEAEARVLAVKAAKEKAQAVASAIDQSIGKAYYINENSSEVIPYPRYGMMKAMDYAESSANGPTIAPGELEVKGKVTVSFVLN